MGIGGKYEEKKGESREEKGMRKGEEGNGGVNVKEEGLGLR